MVRKKNVTTSREGKSTLQEVGVSLSTSTFKRSCNQSKNRRFTTKCKQGQIRLCQKKTTYKSWTTSEKAVFGRLKLRLTCTRMTERKKVWRRLGTANDPKPTTSYVKHGGAV